MTLLDGKILRLDVRAPAPGRPYSIPADNPWPNAQGVRPEIFAYGVRNPWRMSFDRDSGCRARSGSATSARSSARRSTSSRAAGNMGWGMMEGNAKLDPERRRREVRRARLRVRPRDRASA